MGFVAVEKGGEAQEEGRVTENGAKMGIGEELLGIGFKVFDRLPRRRWFEVEVIGVVGRGMEGFPLVNW